ncbi:tetratricopeptide repeat protein, partial [Myxococcota bacterium]|nr:tetratricopeptide repeat protein [Myxococcota bacterium]
LVVKSFLRKGNGGKALDMLLEQVQANPQYPLLHYLLAVVHLRLGNKADSVSQLRQCLKLDPTDPDAWYLLARLYLNSTHANLAEGFLKKSLRYDPLSSKARTLLRNYYIKTEAFSLAADYHQTVIWLSGEKRSVNQAKTLGELLEKANRNDEALKTWKKVLKKLGPDAGIDAVKALARIHLTLSLTGSEKTVYHRKEAARLVKLGLKLRPMDSELVAMGKQVGVKHEVAKSPFESKIRVKGAKHVNKDDDMLFN